MTSVVLLIEGKLKLPVLPRLICDIAGLLFPLCISEGADLANTTSKAVYQCQTRLTYIRLRYIFTIVLDNDAGEQLNLPVSYAMYSYSHVMKWMYKYGQTFLSRRYWLEVISAKRHLLQHHTRRVWLHKNNVDYLYLGSKPGYVVDVANNSNDYIWGTEHWDTKL